MNTQQQALYLNNTIAALQTDVEATKAKIATAVNPKAVVMLQDALAYFEGKLEQAVADLAALEAVEPAAAAVVTVDAQDEVMLDQLVEATTQGAVRVCGFAADLLRRTISKHFGAPTKSAAATHTHALDVEGVGQVRVTYHRDGSLCAVLV